MLLIKRGIILLLIIATFSCSRYMGYGVIKISEDEDKLKSGSLIKITKESRIRDTWVYNSEEENHIEIKKWRVKFFKKIEDANSYLNEFKNYDNHYAIVNRNGHSMRIKPIFNPPAMEVYKLKNNQKVKIIGRTKEKEEIGRFNGYWWKLITDDGIEGWSYDSYLNIYNGDKLIHGKKNEDGPEIEQFFKNVWRPDYFMEMIENRNINLEKFKSKFGLFPDFDRKEITISMPDHYITEKFTDITKTGQYNYQLEDSSIQLDFSYKGMVLVSYTQDFRSYFTKFVTLKSSVTDIIESEKSKRSIKFNEFLFNGPIYKSRAYGEITIGDNNNFLWRNNKNLKSKQLLTSNAGNQGTISFDTFLATSLKGKYDGSITFDFGSRQMLTFLYIFENGGVRFLYVPSGKIKESVIITDNFFAPIQLFFTGK